MNARILAVVGGGTGGHVYPGIAVAQAWLDRVEGGQVVYVGSPTGMEAKAAPAAGLPFEAVEARRLKNAGAVERLKTLVRLPAAIWQGHKLLKRLQPSVVLGVGGYVSGPVVLAAALGRRPCAIAEQNARPGLTNRILARFVRRVYSAFPEVAARLPARKVRQLGNPVRPAFRAAAAAAPAAGATRRVLVIGGSQGAKALNEKLPPALAELRGRFPSLEVRHQTGRGKDEPVRAAYAQAGWPEARVEVFIDDVAAALAWADLVVARAGATTVAELAVIGRPALFVPFPYAADDHQAANAASLVDAGAALMEREETLDHDRLVGRLAELLGEPERLRAMASAARAVARPAAADDIVADLLDLAGEGAR
ncbi:MAG: undecaprenyldiphospho-muramoylpentapeptide beta-N-acetylglucosaminyltransferase [Myxococcales bacterium]|nr:undecaprenyldiphospho-muramoylpentapeptide beta-N-acetylglucosaminyltransferase [Myxococcales bacterium]